MKDKELYLIDATAFCYRAFYAISGLATSFGQPTNAIYGFMNMLNKVLKEKKPEYLAVCFDVSKDTFRLKKFAEYKIQRPPMPDGLSSQIPLIKKIVAAYGIAILEKEGFEADDVIATLVKTAAKKRMPAVIISSDKDMLQLVDENTTVFSPYKDTGTLYDEKKVLERFHARPSQIADILALMGDSVDNIPGVKGIGEKTAAELIQRFGSVENLLKHLDTLEPERLKKLINENIDNLKLSKELAVLDREVDIELDLEKLRINQPDYQELSNLFKYLEFKKLLKSLPHAPEKENVQELLKIADSGLKEMVGPGDELFLSGSEPDNLVFCSKGKVFRLEKLGAAAKGVLADPWIKKVGCDLKKIKVILAKDDIRLEGLYFDLMIAAYLLNPSRAAYQLEDIAWDYLQEGMSSGLLGETKTAELMVRLKPKLEEELVAKSLLNLFMDLEMPLAEVLAQMEISGIKLDLKLLKQLSGELEKRLAELIKAIYKYSAKEFNINSPKQLREVLFTELKLPVVKRSKTGPSTDEEVLRKLADKHALPALLLEYRQLMKLKTTYIDALPQLVDEKTGRIHTSFNQTVTETGRLSSTNPNLQNIPIKTDIGSQIRRSIIASKPTDLLISCDYSQIELRILAHISGDKSLIAAFKENKDIHKITASLIYGIKEKDVDDPMREVAKRINFGIVYGLSAYGLARDLGLPVEDAQNFIDAYFVRYPEVKIYIEEQIKKAEEDGFVTTILGRRRYLPEIKNKNQMIRQMAQRQAVNTPIQGSASDLIKLAMVKIHEELQARKLNTRMLIQIHDELVFEVPQEELAESTDLIRDKMENVLSLKVPVRVSIKKGKNWLDMEEVK